MPRNTTAGFERIPNQAIRNVELSLAAVGLLARLLANGDQYDSIDDVADAYAPPTEGGKRKHGFGRDAYRKAALELEAAGHLVRTEQKGAGSRTKSLVRAIPEKAQARATTESPSWRPPAQTPISADQAQDGKSVAGMTWGNDAYEHVEPTTESPSRLSPAETTLSARHPRDGLSVPDYIQTSFQTSDLTQPAPIVLSDEEEEARAILDSLPPTRRPGRGDRKVLVPPLAELLRLDHPAAELTAVLADHAMPDKVLSLGALMRSWLPEPEPYRAPAATARASPVGCGNCTAGKTEDPETGDPTWCPTCHPERRTTR